MRLRHFCVLAVFPLLSSSLFAVAITDAHPRFLETTQFQTVTEFLTGTPQDGPRVVVRSQPEERTGTYFIVTLDTPVASLPAGTEAVLEILRSDALEAVTHRFPLPASEGRTRELYLGLTGADWADGSLAPVAWRVSLVATETTVAEWKSFLWEMP